MTSFELFKLLKKSTFYFYFYTFFSLNILWVTTYIILCKEFKYFASNYGIINGIKINQCKESCRKEKKWVGLKI